MSKINWLRILQDAGIEYVDRGPNVKRGEINCKCPFCGSADPSHHMGLNLDNGWWACWRNQNHRGKSPIRLLMKLLRCSFARACELAGIDKHYVDPEGFDAVAARVMARDGLEQVKEVRRDFLQMPIKDVTETTHRIRTLRHWKYMTQERGFWAQDMQHLFDWYYMCAGIGGKWADRIVLPYIVNDEVVAWTARAIGPSEIRYRDLDSASCLITPKQTLYNHDAIYEGGHTLIVVEGPIDALKLDLYGRDYGVRAVALSTNSIQDEQIFLLEEGSQNFQQTLTMMDNASQLGIVDSMRMRQKLRNVKNSRIIEVPAGKKDAGELTPTQVIDFARALT